MCFEMLNVLPCFAINMLFMLFIAISGDFWDLLLAIRSNHAHFFINRHGFLNWVIYWQRYWNWFVSRPVIHYHLFVASLTFVRCFACALICESGVFQCLQGIFLLSNNAWPYLTYKALKNLFIFVAHRHPSHNRHFICRNLNGHQVTTSSTCASRDPLPLDFTIVLCAVYYFITCWSEVLESCTFVFSFLFWHMDLLMLDTVAVSRGYDACFSIKACDGLYQLLKSIGSDWNTIAVFISCYSEINQIHLSIEAQCGTACLPIHQLTHPRSVRNWWEGFLRYTARPS